MLLLLNSNEVIPFILVFLAWSLLSANALYRLWILLNFSNRNALIMAGISPLIQILFLFPFKIVGLVDAGVIVLFALYLLIIYLTRRNIILKKISLLYTLILIFVVILGAVYYFNDASRHITVGFIDSITSYFWIENILNLNPAGYQPGYALFLEPYFYIFDLSSMLNFVGSMAGFIVLIHISIIIYAFNKRATLIFLLIIMLPVFLEFNKTLIGVTANALSFLTLAGVVAGIAVLEQNTQSNRKSEKFYILGISLISSAIISPPLSYYLIILSILLGLWMIILKKNILISVAAIAFSLAGFFIYILNAFLSPLFYGASREQNKVNLIDSSNINNVISEVFRGAVIAENSVSSPVQNITIESIDPKLVLQDVFLNVEDIRRVSNYLDLFGYLILIGFVISIIFFTKKNNWPMSVLSIFGAYFGIITMTGFLDFSYIKGRAGWYYLLIFAVFVSVVLALILKNTKIYFSFVLLLALLNIYNVSKFPLVHYRYHDEKIAFKVLEILEDASIEKPLKVNNDYGGLNFINNNIERIPTNEMLDLSRNGNSYLFILDYNKKLIDPILSRQFQFRELNSGSVEEQLFQQVNEKIEINLNYERQLIELDYEIIFKDENYTMYLFNN